MTSASSSSARCLFAESKQRLAERVQVNMNNISSLARQIQRGSKSNEVVFVLFLHRFYILDNFQSLIENLGQQLYLSLLHCKLNKVMVFAFKKQIW